MKDDYRPVQTWPTKQQQRQDQRARLLTPAILTKANFKLWESTSYPFGLKLALSKTRTPLEKVPSNETVTDIFEMGNCVKWFITTGTVRGGIPAVWCRRYYYPHPRFTRPNCPEWVRGPGFCISQPYAAAFSRGLERLLTLCSDDFERFERLYLCELKYCTRPARGQLRGPPPHVIRFFVERKTGSWFRQVQHFCLTAAGSYIPTKNLIYCRAHEPLLMETVKKRVDNIISGAIDSEVIEGPHEFDERPDNLHEPVPSIGGDKLPQDSPQTETELDETQG